MMIMNCHESKQSNELRTVLDGDRRRGERNQNISTPTTSRMLFLMGIVVSMECATVHSFSLSSSNLVIKRKTHFSSPATSSQLYLSSRPNNVGRNHQVFGLPKARHRRDASLSLYLKDDQTSIDAANASLEQQQQQQAQRDLVDGSNNDKDEAEAAFDRLLDTDNPSDMNLAEAVSYLKNHPTLPITKSRWNKIFDAIEQRTALADESETGVNTRQQRDAALAQQQQQQTQQPLSSQARKEMTDMYETLQKLEHLKLFGAVSTIPPSLNLDPDHAAVLPAMGSDQVNPTLLESITGVSMTSLTPKPTNSVLLAGGVLAVIELVTSLTTGISFNFLAFVTLLVAFMDRLLVNGAILESFVKILSPQLQAKIVRHEAGHFLCAYLLGCPVEGCVLSAWAALQDARFGLRRNSVSAGTSFYDPILSQQIHNHISDRSNNNMPMALAATGKVTKSSVNRYSIIVMAGIAAEAMQYGQADGGASDEMALIGFLSQLNRGGNPVWNDMSIRNQARWGALQAILMLRHYQPCYDALVQVLERGGSLGECVYAIEKAARDVKLEPLTRPFGYIVDVGGERQEWKEASVDATNVEPPTSVASTAISATEAPSPPTLSKEESLAELAEYRKMIEQRVQEIDSKLDNIS